MNDAKKVESRTEGSLTPCQISFRRPTEDVLLVRLTGSWRMRDDLPPATEVLKRVETKPGIQRVLFDATELTAWDSSLLTFLLEVLDQYSNSQITVERDGLPQGVRRLLDLAVAVPEDKGARQQARPEPLLARIGLVAIESRQSGKEMLRFVGEAFVAFLKLCGGKARFRLRDLVLTIQECGAQALPIVTLISFLVGLILAFVGAVQLEHFGAQIYIADLVGIAMVREMGVMMTAIVMAGRTGAAFAAQLGTMTVTEEIDAFKTLGFSPMEFLVLPRMLALALMMPLLCLFADLIGIIGGLVVGVGLFDISFKQYLDQTQGAVDLADLAVGLTKGIVYGVIVAFAGCLRGMQCGRSSAAVGAAATSAVVTAIVLIIVTDAVFAVVTNAIGV